MKRKILMVLLLSLTSLLFSAIFMDSKASAAVDEHFIGLWQFNEGTGEKAKDSSERGNDGILKGPKWVKDGKFNTSALKFDGVDDYVEVPWSEKSMKMEEGVTLMAWVRVEKHQLNDNRRIFTHYGDGRSIGSGGYSLGVEKKGQTWFIVHVGGNWFSNADEELPELKEGKWYHLAGTYDHKIGLKFYIDGDLIDEKAKKGKIEDIPGPYLIGVMLIAGDIEALNATIDEVSVSNVARTQDEIQKFMKGTYATAVTPSEKLAVTWSILKNQD